MIRPGNMTVGLFGAAIIVVLAASLGTCDFAYAKGAKEKVLYAFCSQEPCVDGAYPTGPLIVDNGGNFHGVTQQGGANGGGTVFELAPDGTETTLYSFCPETNCPDGNNPLAGVIADSAGNVYGTTLNGGSHGYGSVFEVDTNGTETVLHSFCSNENCADGQSPIASLITDTAGNFYGTTYSGGKYRFGSVFRLAPNGRETVLYSFCHKRFCAEGQNPTAALIADGEGNLYGTTLYGGKRGAGAAFRLSPDRTYTLLHSFCSKRNCSDGQWPGGLLADGAGNLYGMTGSGGTKGEGAIFRLTPDGTETVLHSFCSKTNCADGAHPQGALISDAEGNFYGATSTGGTNDSGTVFKLTPGGKETVLYSFCSLQDCPDGQTPNSGLLLDGAGNLYGTTGSGGNGWGVVFMISPQQR